MSLNLGARLKRIREMSSKSSPAAVYNSATAAHNSAEGAESGGQSGGPGPEWVSLGEGTVQRSRFLDFPQPLPPAFPPALSMLVPDLRRYPGPAGPGNLLFFDLETTGLGGAGTLAFLAAFGRFVSGGALLQVDQYLLLDYPGEPGFIGAVLASIESPLPLGRSALIVSYNGKAFDSQMLRTRCLLNGLPPPEYAHADLLHPARRLWKRLLPSCSQGEIEKRVLGLDREGDIPGSQAPDIWFSFLKNHETGPLLGICDHNLRDIYGLARLFAALAGIAADPLAALELYPYDLESLALHWRSALRHGGEDSTEAAVRALLAEAARRGQYRAARALAVDEEWRRRDPAAALALVAAALADEGLSPELREDFSRRRKRLLRKCGLAGA